MRKFNIPSPKEFFGFNPGTEGKMIDYKPLISYFLEVAKFSDKIKIEHLCTTDGGNEYIALLISNPDNLANINRIAKISHNLADTKVFNEDVVNQLAQEGKAIVVNTMSIHSHEIGGGLASPEIVYDLLTDDSDKINCILDNVIYVLFPSVNPDGQNIVYNFYKKYEGTSLEGTQTYLANYHKFAAHANNRDFFAEHFMESSGVNFLTYRKFHASACIDIHHMQENNHRLVLSSPGADPVREEISPLLLRELSFYGTGILCAAEEAGFTDAVNNYWEFNEETYWSLYATPKFHNIISILCENANTKKGLYGSYITPEYRNIAYKGDIPSVSNPHPFESGYWSLENIVNQIHVCVLKMLHLVAKNRTEILYNSALKAARQTERGEKSKEKGYFLLPKKEDLSSFNKFLNILKNHNIEILETCEPFETVDGKIIEKGTLYVPLAQPNFAMVSALLRKRTVPDNRYTRNPEAFDYSNDGSYNIPGTACCNISEWMGITAIPANSTVTVKFKPFSADDFVNNTVLPLNISDSNAFKIANELLNCGKDVFLNGNMITDTDNGKKISMLRIASLFSPNDDSAFTNYTLHRYGFNYKLVNGLDIRNGALKDVDVLIFSGQSSGYLARDDSGSKTLAEENQHFMGETTAKIIGEFVKKGGRVVTWNGSCNYFIEHLKLPVTDVVSNLPRKKYQVHHSTLKVSNLQNDELTAGILPKQTLIFGDSSAFKILDFNACKPLLKIADNNILSSGLLVGEELIKGKVCALRVKYGDGEFIMYGFDPQYMSLATAQFSLLFNALYELKE